MAATTVKEPPTGEGLTFEKVWAMFQEMSQESARERRKAARERREMHEETERAIKEMSREVAEMQKETDRLSRKNERAIKALNKQMGGLHNSFGELAEYMVAPGVVDLFNDKGYHITKAATCGYKIFEKDKKRRIRAEIDLYMENGDYIIAVEVKTSLGENDIEKHKGRLEILREEADRIGDRRKIRGGMAVAVLSEADRKAVLDAGFYLLEPSGDMMKMDLPEGFVPKEW